MSPKDPKDQTKGNPERPQRGPDIERPQPMQSGRGREGQEGDETGGEQVNRGNPTRGGQQQPGQQRSGQQPGQQQPGQGRPSRPTGPSYGDAEPGDPRRTPDEAASGEDDDEKEE